MVPVQPRIGVPTKTRLCINVEVPATSGMERLPSLAPGSVSVHGEMKTVAVLAEVAACIGLAFCEMLRNAIVHAYPPGESRHVGVHLWRVSVLPQVLAFLLVADSGLGFDNEPPAACLSETSSPTYCSKSVLLRLPNFGLLAADLGCN